ncbi:hypothetical protein T02_140, partial [Trichinella nativa]
LPVRRLCIQLAVFADNCNSTSHNYNIICSLLLLHSYLYYFALDIVTLLFNPQGLFSSRNI